MTESQWKLIENKAYEVLDARENHPEKTLAEMYDTEKMPDDLRQAHQEVDEAVDMIYRRKPFEGDEERLAHLFSLYETMIAYDKEKTI
jgi:hypothetical protein